MCYLRFLCDYLWNLLAIPEWTFFFQGFFPVRRIACINNYNSLKTGGTHADPQGNLQHLCPPEQSLSEVHPRREGTTVSVAGHRPDTTEGDSRGSLGETRKCCNSLLQHLQVRGFAMSLKLYNIHTFICFSSSSLEIYHFSLNCINRFQRLRVQLQPIPPL